MLEVPADYLIGIIGGLGHRRRRDGHVVHAGAQADQQLLAFDHFGKDWVTPTWWKQLKLPGVEVLDAPYGKLPDLAKVRPDADLVFTWNGTTSGVRVPNADFISRRPHQGVTICDATRRPSPSDSST